MGAGLSRLASGAFFCAVFKMTFNGFVGLDGFLFNA
jgi:hypothetical protein